MASRSSVARTSVRLVTSVVVLALGVATVASAAFLDLPQYAAGVPSVTVTPEASDQTRVCPGPAVQIDGSATADRAQGSPSLVSVGAPVLQAGADPSSTGITTSELETPDSRPGGALPTSLTATGADGTLLAGSQSVQVSENDLVGLASTECAEAAPDSWLVAGATTTGRTSFVLLSNPSDVLATVTLGIFGETGLVSAPGTSGIIVQPHSQRALSLAGFAPNLVSPVIHVTSAGGSVLASLQSSVVRLLTPGGIDVVGPTSGPALTQTISGVQVVSTSAIAERATDPASSDLPATLRVYVPGAESATLTVTLRSETLGVADATVNYSATGGIVTEFPFPSLTDDTYAVTVSSDQPIVAGARSAVVSGGVDYAWYQSSPLLAGSFVFTTAEGPNPKLQLVNTGGTDGAVTVTPNAGGAPQTLTVAAGSATGVPLSNATTYTVATSAPLTASVGYLGDGLISAFAVSPASPLASPITLYRG
ncbi:DUF5719 family protein [Subtercola frigoramans]|uniref:Large extracellular alpha-helical protein n=1 Tax=Subtercola frigoramans TaxID=120298 RepID=A0ABS2L8R2_9MICO|nr:DUF5719 family protein [Subtercola frigoramans]MBM7473271.1 hypothetical protein [Subtercola frigoramans]